MTSDDRARRPALDLDRHVNALADLHAALEAEDADASPAGKEVAGIAEPRTGSEQTPAREGTREGVHLKGRRP